MGHFSSRKQTVFWNDPFRVSFNFFRRKSAEGVHLELIHLQFDRNRVTTNLSRTHLRRKAIAVKEWVKCFFAPFWSDTSLKYFIFSPYVVQFLTIYVPFGYTPICLLFILPSWISVLEMYFSYLKYHAFLLKIPRLPCTCRIRTVSLTSMSILA